MNKFVPSDLQKVAIDAYHGISNKYSRDELQDAVRNIIKDTCGGEWNFYRFMDNRYKLFAIIVDLMPAPMVSSLAGKYDIFAEFKDTAVGDLNYFTVEDNQVYNVYTSARGNGDIERQKIIDRNFSVPTTTKSIKFYEELDMFMAGKIDFARLVDKAMGAFENHVGKLIADAIYNSYSSVDTEFKATGAFSATTLASIIENVKAATSADRVQIWGTTTALSSVADGFGYSDNAKDRANSFGYYGQFRGSDLIALPQAYAASTQTFAIDTAHLIVLPANEKIVKGVFEGTPFMNMTDGTARNDLQPEVTFSRRVGVSAITVPEGLYGFYKLT